MSKLLRFELNKSGVRELLRCEAMQNILKEYAEQKAGEAGEGYSAEVHTGQNRAYANVFPEAREAYFDNLENNTLEKVIRS